MKLHIPSTLPVINSFIAKKTSYSLFLAMTQSSLILRYHDLQMLCFVLLFHIVFLQTNVTRPLYLIFSLKLKNNFVYMLLFLFSFLFTFLSVITFYLLYFVLLHHSHHIGFQSQYSHFLEQLVSSNFNSNYFATILTSLFMLK